MRSSEWQVKFWTWSTDFCKACSWLFYEGPDETDKCCHGFYLNNDEEDERTE